VAADGSNLAGAPSGADPPLNRHDSGPEAAREAALRLLSVRARSSYELRSRLLEKGFPRQEVSSAVAWLQERGYLNDQEFAAAYVRDRVRFSPRSHFLLKRELGEKGVDADVASRVLDQVFQEEGWTTRNLAARVARGWVRKQGPAARRALLAPRFTDERERVRGRLYRFLARRGFVGEAVSSGMETGERAARDLDAG